MAAPSYATLADYELRYGPSIEPERVTALLGDASAFIASQPGFRELAEGDEGYGLQRANLTRVACSVARRSEDAGDLAGVSNYSQSAVGISASVTLANPAGDFYLTKAEKRSIGIGSGRVGQTDPFGSVVS